MLRVQNLLQKRAPLKCRTSRAHNLTAVATMLTSLYSLLQVLTPRMSHKLARNKKKRCSSNTFWPVCTPLTEKKIEKSLLPADSLQWVLYFDNNIGLVLCTSSISSSSSLGGDIRNCRSFELLVDKLSAKIPPCCFSELAPRAISGFKMVGGQTGPPHAVYKEVGSS